MHKLIKLIKKEKNKILILINFEFFYHLVIKLIIIPLFDKIFCLGLKISHLNYLNYSQVNTILYYPIMIIVLLFIFLFIAWLIYLEITVLILVCANQLNGCSFLGKIKRVLKRSSQFFRLKNISLFPLLLVAQTIYYPLTFPIFDPFKFSVYMQTEIMHPINLIITLIFCFYLFIHYYTFMNMIINEKSYPIAFMIGIQQLKRSFFKTLYYFIISYLAIIFISSLLSIVCYSITCLFYLSHITNYLTTHLYIIKDFFLVFFSVIGPIVYHDTAIHLADVELESEPINFIYKSFIILSVAFFGTTNLEAISHKKEISNQDIQSIVIIGHKGNSQEAVENTMPAFQMTVKRHLEVVELDVRLTKDKQVVVFHDNNMKRMTGIDQDIQDMTVQELSEISILKQYSGKKRITIPLLSEVVSYAKGKMQLLIELKANQQNYDELAKAVVDILKEYQMEDQCMIQSFNYDAIQCVKKYDPSIVCGLCADYLYGDFYDLEDIRFFSLKESYLDEKVIDDIHQAQKEVYVWTVDNQEDMRKFMNLKVDGIISNCPVIAQNIKDEEIEIQGNR